MFINILKFIQFGAATLNLSAINPFTVEILNELKITELAKQQKGSLK